MLPFSRMTQFPSTIRATAPTRLASLHKDHFDEMFRRIPDIQPRLVGLLTDRVRESTRADQQREKLAALGKLSAGLAHELNNPASAVRRSTAGLREALANLRDANFGLCREELSDEVLEHLSEIEKEVATEMTGSPVMDALERSDREDHITAWLEKRGVTRPWELAPALVEAEADDECLEKMSAQFPGKTLEFALRRMSATIEVEKILRQIESSAARISDLVKAIKEYTYMDQSGEKEIDLHEGLESTLTMLHHDLKNGINVRREYDRSLPKICAQGKRAESGLDQSDRQRDRCAGGTGQGGPRSKSPFAPRGTALSLWSTLSTTAPVFRRRSRAASSIRSSPPSRWVKAPASDSIRCTGLSASMGAISASIRIPARRTFRCGCRFPRQQPENEDLPLPRAFSAQ